MAFCLESYVHFVSILTLIIVWVLPMKIKPFRLWMKSSFKTWIHKFFPFTGIFSKFNLTKPMKRISHVEFFINHYLCNNKYLSIFTKQESHLMKQTTANKYKNKQSYLKMILVDQISISTKKRLTSQRWKSKRIKNQLQQRI